MTSLHWNYKDVFRACRLGFSARKIWLMVVGLAAGGLGYTLLTYVAYWASGVPPGAVWERFTLIPFLDPCLASPNVPIVGVHWWSWIIYCAGIAWFLLAWLVAGATVARITFEQLRGDDFFENRDAFGLARQHLGSIVAPPMMPLAFAAFLVAAGLVVSLLGLIPAVGEIFVGALALPAFAVSLFIVYLLVIAAFALVLAPAVVGTTRNDAFDTLFEVFSCVNDQPWRLVFYTALLKGLTLFAGLVLGVFATAAIRIGGAVLGTFMGPKFQHILAGGAHYLHLSPPSWCPLHRLCETTGMLFGGADLTANGVGAGVGAVLVGVTAYAVLLLILGYMSAVWHAGTTVIFCVLSNKKDDKNLLTEKDTEELLDDDSEHGGAE